MHSSFPPFVAGDLWSGSEAGAIKIWPWETIENSLSLTTEERPMAALLVERSFIDPRGQVAVNGFGNILTSDVRYLLSDISGAKVWSAGYLSFALWYILTSLFCSFEVSNIYYWCIFQIYLWSKLDSSLYTIIK